MKKTSNNKEKLTIRKTELSDVPVILSLIKELAVYEKLSDKVVTDEEAIRKTLFGEKTYAEALLAIWEGHPAGMVIFFHNYSTFLGKPGFYIEDLYVKEQFRGLGIGKELLLKCVQIARERDCGRMEWLVLDWNPARKFYEKLGAYPLEDWTVYRMDKKTMDNIV
ncbi:MAG: GNAT family N-acetyltransferase [Atribacterota bacterium]|nr:GNAT family N-acetyltransferase [Atribacterota bacterium]